MNKSGKIYVAGHTGMVGSAIVRKLQAEGYQNIIGKTIEELDLTNQQAVVDFFKAERPECVFLAAAKVGGIQANNTYRAQFIYENLMIQNNIIHNSYVFDVKKLLFLGSSCIYPKNAPQPLKEEYLLTGDLEATNEPYAIAKIAGIKMCENYYRQYGCDFLSVMPTNLYGPNDNYNLETSHVLPALLRKMHLAKCLDIGDWEGLRKDFMKHPIEGVDGNSDEDDIVGILSKYGIQRIYPASSIQHPVSVKLWGTGQVSREFMHVDDMAAASIMIMENQSYILHPSSNIRFLNIGVGVDQTIQELAQIIRRITGYLGEIKFDNVHPDGTYKKLLDISRLQALDFLPQYTLEKGIEKVYDGYLR